MFWNGADFTWHAMNYDVLFLFWLGAIFQGPGLFVLNWSGFFLLRCNIVLDNHASIFIYFELEIISDAKMAHFQALLRWKYWISGIVCAILISFGCVGNFLTISILKKPSLASAFHQLLIWLCVIDTFFLLTNITTTIQALGKGKSNFIYIIGPTVLPQSYVWIVKLRNFLPIEFTEFT